jgi:hypothetical protein
MGEHYNDSALDAQTPILENMVVGMPPVFQGLTRQLETIVEQPLLGPKSEFPKGKGMMVVLWSNGCVLMQSSVVCVCKERCVWEQAAAGYCAQRIQSQVP